MIASGAAPARSATASAAVRAVTVSYSGGWNALRKACWITGSSSISRIFGTGDSFGAAGYGGDQGK